MQNTQILVVEENEWHSLVEDDREKSCAQKARLGCHFEEHPEVLKNRVKGGDAEYQSVNEWAIIDLKNDRIDAC